MKQKLLARTCLVMVMLACPLVIYAGARPGAKDAACDAVDLKYRSTSHNVTRRELNFILFDASSQGCLDLVTTLLDKGASVEARDRFGNTAFLLAAHMGHTDIMALLVDMGSDMQQLNLAGSSAILRAVTANRRKAVKYLLDADADPNVANVKGVTPLIAATFNGNKRLVNLLLSHGADATAMDASGKGAVVFAAGKGYLAILNLLLEDEELDINARYGNSLTALMWAAGHSNDVPDKEGVAVVEYLISKGSNLNLVDNRGRSALMIASERNHASVVITLLADGAKPDTRDNGGLSARDLAASEKIRRALE